MLRSEPTHPSMCKLAARALVLLAVLSGSFLVGNAIAVNFNLTVAKGGSGSGLVAADVGAVNCGGICSGVYPSGTLITLTATPAGSSQFTGWLGPCTGLGACQFTINSPTTV